MAEAGLSVPIVGSVQVGIRLRRLSEQLGESGRRDLTRKMRRNIRVAASPVMADLRRAVMGVQVSSSKKGLARPNTDTQLRSRIAGAIGARIIWKGIRLVVNPRRVGSYGAALPKYLDASITGYVRWRHPVLGHDVWVEQRGQPWWFKTIDRHTNDFRRAVLDGLDEFARELAR